MAALAMDAEWNDPDDGWIDELDYQPQGPFCSQQELEAHREFLDVGVGTSSVGLSAGPPAWQESESETDSEDYEYMYSEAEQVLLVAQGAEKQQAITAGATAIATIFRSGGPFSFDSHSRLCYRL